MTRRVAVGFVVWLAVSVLLLCLQYAQVIGNLEAQIILGGWPAIGAAAWIKGHMAQHQAAMHARLDAHAAELAAHREDLAAMAEKVGEIHDVHVNGRLPKRIIRP